MRVSACGGICVCVCELFFFLREVLVDNLLPAAVAASRSSQQWEKEPGRRVKREGWGPGGLLLPLQPHNY